MTRPIEPASNYIVNGGAAADANRRVILVENGGVINLEAMLAEAEKNRSQNSMPGFAQRILETLTASPKRSKKEMQDSPAAQLPSVKE